MLKIKSFFKEAFQFYRSSLAWITRKILSFIWGGFAVLGILALGTIFGYETAKQPVELSESQKETDEEAR